MTSLFTKTAALVSLFFFLAAPLAHAGHDRYASYNPGNGYGSYHRRSVSLGFDRLNARVERDRLVVDYRIQKQSWKMVQRQGIVPVLRVERLRGGFVEARLPSRAGVVSFDLERGMRDDITVSVAGARGNVVVDSLWLNGAPASRLVLAVARPRPPRPLPFSLQRAVIDACVASFEGRYNEQECLRMVDSFAFDPAHTIRACDAAMDGDANEMACLQTAARSRMDATRQLQACEAALDGDANELSCFAKVVTARFDMAPAINECEIAFDGDANELACIDTTLRFQFDPVPAIRACSSYRHGDPAELACLARY